MGRTQGRGRLLQEHDLPRQDRGRVRRPPEQAGHRLQRGAPVVRRGQGGRDRRRAHLLGGARGQHDRQGQEQGVPELGCGDLGSHRQGLLAQHRALDLRHLGARQRHRQRHRQDGRRLVVLPDGRLCLRPCARARYGGRGGQERRQGGRQGPAPLPGAGLLVLPAAGAGLQGQDHRPRQRRRRYHERDQAGGRVRHRAGRAEPRRPARLHHGRACPRPQDGAGPDLHGSLVLGPERRQPRLREGIRRRQQGQHADDGAGGRLLGRHALPQGGARDEVGRRRRGRGGQDEVHADGRQAVRQGLDPAGRPQDPRHVSLRGEEAR